MKKALENLLGLVVIFGLLLSWPFVSGWKAWHDYEDIRYNRELVLFFSFVGLFLYVLAAWRVYEWHIHGKALSGWLWALALLYIGVSIIRGALHVLGIDEDEETQ